MTYTKTIDGFAAARTADVWDTAGRRHGFRASWEKLSREFYLVIHETGAKRHFAYRFADVRGVAVSARDWDYLAWRKGVKPEENLEPAVHYFMMKHGKRELARDDGTNILTGVERTALALRAEGKPSGAKLSPEQGNVLDIATRLGWLEPPSS